MRVGTRSASDVRSGTIRNELGVSDRCEFVAKERDPSANSKN